MEESLENKLSSIEQKLDKLTQENEQTNTRVDAYQKASTQVVNLAFSLIASATITLIITSVFKR